MRTHGCIDRMTHGLCGNITIACTADMEPRRLTVKKDPVKKEIYMIYEDIDVDKKGTL